MKSTDSDLEEGDFADISSASDSESDSGTRMPSYRISARNIRRVRWTKKELKMLGKMVEEHMRNSNTMSEEDWENAAKALNEKFPETATRTAIKVQRQWNLYGCEGSDHCSDDPNDQVDSLYLLIPEYVDNIIWFFDIRRIR